VRLTTEALLALPDAGKKEVDVHELFGVAAQGLSFRTERWVYFPRRQKFC